ncbi:MAG: YwaF family protein [Firmicutes bacterium]|nr:YwaF family protein [Bacillota bacterium]
MFTIQHFVWLAISAIFIATTLFLLRRYRPGLTKFLSICCVGCIISEVLKISSVIVMVPTLDGTNYTPYIPLTVLPLHLCSIQIIHIYICRFAKPGRLRDTLLAFMYSTCIAGAFFALMIPTLFIDGTVPLSQAFVSQHCYEYFLFHSLLITLGVYIPMSGEVKIQGRHFFSSLALLGLYAFVSLYLNSVFSTAVYEDGVLVAVKTTNFFFTYSNPLGIVLSETWQWAIYLGIILMLAIVLLGAFYLPFRQKKGEKIAC